MRLRSILLALLQSLSFVLPAPAPSSLPHLEPSSLCSLLLHLSPSNVALLLNVLLCETSVLLVSSPLSIVAPCCEALSALLWPLQWPYVCVPLLPAALKAAKAHGLPEDKIFLIELPGIKKKGPYATVDDLIAEGKKLPELEPLRWVKGQGARQPAYLCYSSGTSGLPVGICPAYAIRGADTL